MFTYTVYMHVRKITCKIYVLGLSHDRAVFIPVRVSNIIAGEVEIFVVYIQKIFLRINVRWKNF